MQVGSNMASMVLVSCVYVFVHSFIKIEHYIYFIPKSSAIVLFSSVH